MLPEPSRDEVLQAFKQFDRDLRPHDTGSDGDDRELPQYAVEYDGQLYPPGRILSLTSGIPISDLGDVDEINRVFTALRFPVVPVTEHRAARRRRQVWWVNQGAAYDESRAGGLLWAPRQDKRGPTWGHRKRPSELQPDDLVVHFADARIRAIGRVMAAAVEARTPFESEPSQVDGWRVDVEYFELRDGGIPIGRAIELFEDLALDDGPFTDSRGVKQGFLWRFSPEGLQRIQHEVGSLWPEWAHLGPADPSSDSPFRLAAAVQQLTDAIAKRGFVFEPWQVAAFVTAVRTKPFVILAGVSGTGKSRLPGLVAEATRCAATVIPVRPDWTDSSDVLGYVDLQRSFCPGPLLEAARRATRAASRFHFCVIDEMNLARVEHYLAEVLSRIEGRSLAADGTMKTAPLLTLSLAPDDAREWGAIALPPNLAIVGTVNMDESAHGFSRKVLDRAFTLELSEIDLHQWAELAVDPPTVRWPLSAWRAGPRPLARRATGDAREIIDHVVDVLVQVNAILTQAQLQVGYRTRDEIALFVLNAADARDSFVTRDGTVVTPLDLALVMKILPRIAGGSAPVRQVVIGLLGFATRGKALDSDQQADEIAAAWRSAGRPAAVAGASFPRTAARLCLMWDRLVTEGFTSFWL